VRVVVVGDNGAGDGDPGFVGERLEQHGATLVPVDRDALPAYDELGGVDLLLLLGSARSVRAHACAAAVAAESRLLLAARGDGVPTIGICYGAQLVAHALGGVVTAAPRAEVGWYEVESDDPMLCPPGPWVQFHLDAFVPPPGARVLGRSAAGIQGYTLDRLVAWQFHPEVTPSMLRRWLAEAPSDAQAAGSDPEEILAFALAHQAQSRVAARALTDSALEYLAVL
jgi:GMP synthase-like glutamine amidotransferase